MLALGLAGTLLACNGGERGKPQPGPHGPSVSTAPAAPVAPVAPAQPAPQAAAPAAAATPATAPASAEDEAAKQGPQSRAPVMGQEELRRRFPPFPKALTPIESIGQQMVAHGLPMTIAYFETRARPIEVLEYYARYFSERSYFIADPEESRKLMGRPALSATDPRDKTQLSVLVNPNEEGQPTTVILAIADTRLEALVPPEGELPPYPGASAPLNVKSSEVGGAATTVFFSTTDPAAAVAAFYQKKMPELGYQASGDGAILLFSKADRRWQVRLDSQKGTTAVTAIGMTRQMAREEEQP
ncbi:MAG TPA: hypothetical protein VGK67_18220 [Myxococcales bacterium]|jgi:hypothetical protein